MDFDEAETSAEVATVRAAVANGFLTARQLREALLLREEYANLGHSVGLLQLLRQHTLPARALPELSAVYQQVLNGLGVSPKSYDAVPSGLAPKAIARARLLVQQHPGTDPPRVKVFLNRVGIALGYGSSASEPVPRPSGSGSLVAPVTPSDTGPVRSESSSESARLAADPTTQVPVAVRGQVGSDTGPVIPHTDEVRAHSASVDQNAATVAASAVQRFGRYLVESELARGGMGVVYKAKDPHLDRYVALKVMRGEGFELDPVDEQRFVREAKATAKMRHPNIVTVLDTGSDHGSPYLVMDLVQGESLGDRIKRAGPLDPPEAARIAAAVARALDYSHGQGVLHRDVKPNNILLEPNQGTPLLTDFGLARHTREDASRLTGTGQAVGTPSYMAPEQATGEREQLGPPTDVYGLGATLYHMLAGRPPFRGSTLSILHSVVAEAPKPLRDLRESVPRELDAVCMRCLAKEPGERFQTAGQLAEALESALRGDEEQRPTRPAPRPAREETKPRERPAWGRWVLLGISLLGVLGLGASYLTLWRTERVPTGEATPRTPPTSRADLARRYLQAMHEDPQAGPAWQRKHQLYPPMGKGPLPWQVATGLEVAPTLPPRSVVIAVVLGLADRFADADRFLGEGGEALALRAELRLQARRHDDARRLLERAPDSLAVQRERAQFYASVDDFSGALGAARSLPADSPLRAGIEDEVRVCRLSDPERRLLELQGLLESPTQPANAFRLRFARAQALLELRRYAELDEELAQMKELRPDSPLIPHARYQSANAERDYPAVTRALEEGLAYERDPTQRAMLGWLRVQSLWLSGDRDLSRAARKELVQDGFPPDDALQLAAQICLLVEAPDAAVVFAKAGWASTKIEPEARWTCLEVQIDGLRATGAWAELRASIEGLVGEPLPNDLQQKLADAHAEATRALEER